MTIISQISSNLQNVTLSSVVIIILLITSGSAVSALQVTNSNLNTSEYYQGDGGNISLTLYNDNSLVEWYINTVTIQFDWMVSANTSYQTAVNQNIVSGGSGTYIVQFSIPTATSVGWHTYTVSYIGLYSDTHTLLTGNIYIHDVNERIYYNLKQGVTSDISSAVNSGYQSPDARADLSQAQSDFSLADNYASNGQFVNGINELQTARNLIVQANSAEQSYRSSHSYFGGGSSGSYGSSNNNYSGSDYSGIILLAIIAAGIAGAVIVVIIKIKKKGKVYNTQYNTSSSPVKESQSNNTEIEKKETIKEPIMETQESTVEIKNPPIEEPIKKILAESDTRDVKITKLKPRKKSTKTKLEKEQDAKALSILKERLAKGTVSKDEYDRLKKEFE